MRDGTCVSITQSRLANSEAGGACQNCQFPSRIPIPTLVLSENALAATDDWAKQASHARPGGGRRLPRSSPATPRRRQRRRSAGVWRYGAEQRLKELTRNSQGGHHDCDQHYPTTQRASS
jgi:hypothetical protein